ncbi:MAG: sulfite exporter TauE/SafE family protein, partial [Steroidobacter sp.]
AGLTGSMHCLVMCGGIAGALGMRARTLGQSAPRAFTHSLLYQFGRLSSYAVAGMVVVAFGETVQALLQWLPVAQTLRMLSGLLLIALGLQLMFHLRLLQPLENMGAVLWRRVAPLAQHTSRQGWLGTLLFGALWGWMPCGLIYSMLLLGALGGSATHGAMIMLAFGLGTLPAMLSSSVLAAQLTRITTLREMRISAGVLMMALGWWTMWFAIHHHG